MNGKILFFRDDSTFGFLAERAPIIFLVSHVHAVQVCTNWYYIMPYKVSADDTTRSMKQAHGLESDTSSGC